MESIIKIILIGDAGIGKTSIINSYLDNNNDSNSTVGLEFHTLKYDYKGEIYRIHLWDTAGQERFRSMIKNYYRKSDIVVIVYDTTNIESQKNMDMI